jgi:hypothetical protein
MLTNLYYDNRRLKTISKIMLAIGAVLIYGIWALPFALWAFLFGRRYNRSVNESDFRFGALLVFNICTVEAILLYLSENHLERALQLGFRGQLTIGATMATLGGWFLGSLYGSPDRREHVHLSAPPLKKGSK